MKHVLAIVLLCLPAQISAGGRCPAGHADRSEVRAWPVKAAAPRATLRVQKLRALAAWQRAVLFEQQIL